MSNEDKMYLLWPIFVGHLTRFFEGKDARDLDALVEAAFVDDSYYKFQGLAIWVPIASAEFAILDLLGQVSGRPVGALFGRVIGSKIPLYRANNHRGRSAEESVARIRSTKDRTRTSPTKRRPATCVLLRA